jgi:dTDP-4-dehydrorhamnose reductase
MILLLGATGYIGQAFATELRRRGYMFIPLTRKAIDYTNFDILFDYVRKSKPQFLINAAGYTGFPNVDACEFAHAETLQGNALFPQTVARVCTITATPWGHVSSGCIYSGAKVLENGHPHVERDLNQSRLQQLFTHQPERFYGFTETDEPTFSFRSPPCSFYSGTKALAEEALRGFNQCYIWRLRIPFDEFDHPRNYLSKIQAYPRVYDTVNSLSHRGDFIRACLDLWDRRAPTGIYNVTNPGAVRTRQVVEEIQRVLKPARRFEFWKDDAEFYRYAAIAPRSNCILDASKLLDAGVRMRPVHEALKNALARWQPAANSVPIRSFRSDSIPENALGLVSAERNAENSHRPSQTA